MDATSICNLALAQLGQSQIMSLDDASQAARFCKRLYGQTLDEVLRSHPWNFATRRQTLSRLSDDPLFGWAYQYALPDDFLRLLQLNAYSAGDSLKLHEVERRRLLTNEGVAQIRYVGRVTDANLFDPLFVEALATKIASKLAQPLTGSREEAGALLTAYERIVAPLARGVDAREGRARRRLPYIESMLVQSRGGGAYSGGEGSGFGGVSLPSVSTGSSAPVTVIASPEKGRDFIFNVMDYGVKAADGDDYPGILAAKNALLAKGRGTLYFPGGYTYRIKTPGVHGIHLEQRSNIRIEFGEGAKLVMENMEAGLGVSHGIYVQGPCENITLSGVHVAYATMSVSRQGWAPIYFLGANVGTGNEALAHGWYRGSPDGVETPSAIEAGACRNILLENVVCENSPSVGVGLVGVDGIVVRNFKLVNSWADGLYHLYFRRSQIDGAHFIRTGDDAISMASYESDLAGANIDHSFHGEGSSITNVVIEDQWERSVPSGSLVFLGVRDISVSGYVIRDRFRGIRFHCGTHKTQDYPTLNLSFLANRNIVVDGGSIRDCTQAIALLVGECNYETPEKWWRQNITISDLSAEGGFSPIDIYGPGIPQNGGTAIPIISGLTLSGCTFRGFTSEYTTLLAFENCAFENVEIDSFLAIQGSVPYGHDPDAVDGDGQPLFFENRSTFRNIRGRNFIIQGVKRCHFDNLQSINAPQTGVSFSSCADVTFGRIHVLFPNRFEFPTGGGVTIDQYCKRVIGDTVEVETDDKVIGSSLTLTTTADCHVRKVRVKSPQGLYSGLQSDSLQLTAKQSQIGHIEYLHTGQSLGWMTREFPVRPVLGTIGDADFGVYVDNTAKHFRIVDGLTAHRTWTLANDGAAYGERIEVTRMPSSGGNYSLIFRGQAPALTAYPENLATGGFDVTGGGPGASFTSILVEAVPILGAPVMWATSHEATAAAITAQINANVGGHGFTSRNLGTRVLIVAPTGSGATLNNALVTVSTSGEAQTSYVERLNGGAALGVAGETNAAASFLLVGGTPPHGHSGSVTSLKVNGIELLAHPVPWRVNNQTTCSDIQTEAMSTFASHGFTISGIMNSVFIKAPPGHGASANGWVVEVTVTGDLELLDVAPLTGGIDAPIAAAAPAPYAVVTTKPGQPFHAIFEFTGAGWELHSLAYLNIAYANGRALTDAANYLYLPDGNPLANPGGALLYPGGSGNPISDGLRLYNPTGQVLADEYKNILAANGAVIIDDQGKLRLSSAAPASSTAFGVAGMMVYNSSYLYVCVGASSWKRVALTTF